MSAEKPAEGDAVFEYDGKVFSFDEEKHFKRITYKASDSFTDHQYSNILDYNGTLYAKKHRKQLQVSIHSFYEYQTKLDLAKLSDNKAGYCTRP